MVEKSKTKKNMKQFLKKVYRCRMLYAMILPSIITVFIFDYIPIYGVQIAFKDYRTSLGIMESEWVGLKHFLNFFKYPYFGKIMRNTLWISLFSFCTFPCPIIFSLMLNEMKNGKLKKICQTVTYAPHFISVVVLCSITQIFLGRDGLFNILSNLLHQEYVDLLSIPSAFAPIYAVTGIWQDLGWGTIIYLATLSGVSMELVEAAKIDGATRLRIIWNVYLPHLKPTIITMLILRLGSLVSVGFEKTFLLQNPLNLEASSVIATYSYEIGIINHQFSYSTAIGLFNNVINIILIVIANTISKKVAKTGLW